MPYDDPDPADSQMLVGVTLPGSAASTREMVETFADEFAQLGLDRERILALYRVPFYAGAHAAWRHLGESEIARIVDESLMVWGLSPVLGCEAPVAAQGGQSRRANTGRGNRPTPPISRMDSLTDRPCSRRRRRL